MKPARTKAFASPAAFRAWLARHHTTTDELFVRCAKVATGRGLTYRQALDEALCMGWIDGVRHALDAASFSVRFTPRQARSAWSAVNVRRYKELDAEGRVRPQGRAAFEAGTKSRYSFESRRQALAPAFVRRFRANARAWSFFGAQPPWYRRTCSFWVMSAKRPATRERRLARLIALSARGEGVPPLKTKAAKLERPKQEA